MAVNIDTGREMEVKLSRVNVVSIAIVTKIVNNVTVTPETPHRGYIQYTSNYHRMMFFKFHVKHDS